LLRILDTYRAGGAPASPEEAFNYEGREEPAKIAKKVTELKLARLGADIIPLDVETRKIHHV
jgi:hypothetical protein